MHAIQTHTLNFAHIHIHNINDKQQKFSFLLQYRAAVSSSVHSTPSKSFINPNSSPQSTTSNSSSSRHNSPNQSMIKNNHSQPLLPPHAYALQQKQRSFLTFGFGAGGSGPSRRESHVNVNVTPTSHDASSDTPEIRKYKKRFNSEILCAALWGVNLLIGTENGLMLLDRSGQGKVSCLRHLVSTVLFHGNDCNRVVSIYQPGLSTDLKTSIPANGSLRRPKYSCHNIGKEEPCSSLLFVLAEIKDSADRWFIRCE